MTGFTDIHSHFVYGVDDGARSCEEMAALLDAAYANGIRTLVATPHQTPGIAPFHEELFFLHLREAYDYCQGRGYDISLYTGAEILYTPALEPYARQRRLSTYANTRHVLVEFLLDITVREMEKAVTLLEECGYLPVIAHVERYACMGNGNAYRLKERHDVCYQVNCGSILGGHGFFRDCRVKRWLKDDLIDAVATDMHSMEYRPPQMAAAYRALEALLGRERAEELTKPVLRSM